MTKQTNLPPNSHITLDMLLCTCSIYNIHRGVLGTTVNPDKCTCRICVDGRIYSDALRVEANFFKSATKNIRVKKYPDTCGRSLKDKIVADKLNIS